MSPTIGNWDTARDSLRGWWRRNWLTFPLCIVLSYFGYHAIHGNRGLQAWVAVRQDIVTLEAELEAKRAERLRLEKLIEGLRPDHVDQDLLQEELRALGYIKKNEVIVLTPDREP